MMLISLLGGGRVPGALTVLLDLVLDTVTVGAELLSRRIRSLGLRRSPVSEWLGD